MKRVDHSAFWRRALAHLATLTSLLLPWFSLITALPLISRPEDTKDVRVWAFVWLVPFGLLSLIALGQGELRSSLTLLGQGVLACAAFLLLQLPRPAIQRGLQAALLIFLAVGLFSQLTSRIAWRGYAPGLVSIGGVTTQEGIEIVTSVAGRLNNFAAFKLWQVPAGTYDLSASFEARATTGNFGWSWQWDPKRVEEPYQLQKLSDTLGPFVRVINPVGPDPYLYRTYELQRALGGDTFRAAVALRAAEPGTPCGSLNLVEEGGQHLGTTNFCLTPTWQRFELVWTAPATATKQTLVLVINKLAGHKYDVGQVEVAVNEGERWRELRIGAPAGIAARLTVPGTSATVHAIPTSQWTRYRIEVPNLELTERQVARLDLQVEEGVRLETRRVNLSTNPEKPVRPLASLKRQSFRFGHPNLAGHSFAVVGLVLLVSARSVGQGALGISLAFFVIALTGSRTALVGLTVGSLLFFLFSGRASSRRWASGILILSVLLALTFGGFNRSFTAEGSELINRLEVWQVAWQAFSTQPLVGLGESFELFWRRAYQGASQETLQHAHNLWLEFAVRFGLLGLGAMLWLTAGLSTLAWRWGKGRGLTLIAPLLLMNMVDVTLFYSSVLFPFILGLNALRGVNSSE